MFEDTVNFCTTIVYGFVFTHELPVNQTDPLFLNGFLSDYFEITSCEYTKTIIHLRLS